MSSNYAYQPMPNQPRSNSQNQGPNMRGEWKSHNRGAGPNNIGDRSHELPLPAVSQSASTNTAPKNSTAHYYNNGYVLSIYISAGVVHVDNLSWPLV